jgi:acetylglutamate kinase
MEIQHFHILEFDNKILGCAQVKHYDGISEIACFAINENYQNMGYGKKLLEYCENECKKVNNKTFIMTTQSSHWFIENDFKQGNINDLPDEKKKGILPTTKFKNIFKGIGAIMAPNDKAKILSEALPYIKQFFDKTIVIKFGGNAMIDEQLKSSFAMDVVLLKLVGMNPVVVHGGGPQINEHLEKIGKKGEFINGVRVTDEETMDVVEMILGGQINKEIVHQINIHGGKAVGLTGQDGNFIHASKLDKDKDGKKIDLGYVGKIESIDPSLIDFLDTGDFIPVIAPIGIGSDGKTYNINADVVAGKLAEVLMAEKLILMTNTKGVLDNQNNLITGIKPNDIETLIKDGTLSGGMLPKIESAMDAAKGGVNSVHIIDGRVEHALLLEILTNQGVGTLIKGKN